MVLEELGLTYESVYLDFSKKQHKAPEFTKYNPNGRIPALIDHQNGDFVIWCVAPPPRRVRSKRVSADDDRAPRAHRESAAIMLYLVDKYDTEHKVSVADANDKFQQLQWLFFQASGQGCVSAPARTRDPAARGQVRSLTPPRLRRTGRTSGRRAGSSCSTPSPRRARSRGTRARSRACGACSRACSRRASGSSAASAPSRT